MNRKSILAAVFTLLSAGALAQSPASWYESTRENKPYVRWWWHGSAVDRPGLSYNLEEFARAGIGGVEITPIYGVQDNEAADIPFLSPEWMDMYKFTLAKASSLGLEVDMNCGTGWPFGGPEITPDLAAQKMQIEGGTVKCVQTGQKVKRAAPGGEGFVMNHYDPEALKVYLAKFDKAFEDSGAAFPDTWFNDSYEVYGADWTAALPEIFKQKYGYDIVEKLVGAKGEERLRALCDYRECLGQILQDNFLEPWAEWAHSHGARVRNQSHGSPANILDLYASVDIPECETFGRSDFDIPGLRQDAIRRPNDGDPCALKFASSAAHLTGKKYVSCETLTWLTEHFRTSLSQAKPEIDRAFCAGVNHIFFHGATYSPYGVQFPGWMFYASVNMSPTSSMWRDAPALFKYIERSQAFLSAGSPDSDFLLYMPIYDCWNQYDERAMVTFVIHSMDKTIPELKAAMSSIIAAGFDADYISDKLLQECDVKTPVIVPSCKYMPLETARRLLELKNSGVPVYFVGNLPEDVPGLADLKARRREFRKIVRALGKPVSFEQVFAQYTPETFRTECGGEMIRRVNEEGGYNYFFALTGSKGVDGWVKLAKGAGSAVIFDPMLGESGKAQVRKAPDGCAEVRLQMSPGQSVMLKTFPADVEAEPWLYIESEGPAEVLDAIWSISFPESSPAIKGNFSTRTPVDWTTLDVPEAKVNQGTARYTTAIVVDPLKERPDDWILDLGDVRESAEVVINGEKVATLVSVPFKVRVGKWLKPGINTLDVYVTNLASNKIADYDRRGVKWRIFKDANIATMSDPDFGKWATDPSGLVSEVTLTPVRLSCAPEADVEELTLDPTFSAEAVLDATRRVNDYYMTKYSDPTVPVPFPSRRKVYESIIWTRGVYYEGLMNLYQVDPRQSYLDYTRAWGDFHDWGMRFGDTFTRNADNYCCAQAYIEMWRITGEDRMIQKTLACMDNLEATAESDADWTWIDAIQMGMPALVKLGRYEKAWRMYKWSRDNFLNTADGLWWRDKDFKAPAYLEPNGEDCYWSRGNGWVFAALARVLDELPAREAHRSVYESDFRAMAAALALCQRADGTWNPSLHDQGNWGGPEATGTSLFAFGLAWGIRSGLLDSETYLPVLQKAWQGLCSICLHESGFVGYSQGTGKEPKEAQPLSFDRIPDFEDFGTGCVLLAGSEIVKLLRETPSPVYSEKFETRGQKPFKLDIPVPDGNYLVTVTLGDSRRASVTTIKAESRRLCVKSESVARRGTKTVSFVVNKRKVTPDVKIKSREEGKLDWDDFLNLEISGDAPAVKSITVEPAPAGTVTVFLCGDSTVVDQDSEPWASWGQMAPCFFDSSVAVANYAESGERADSFIAEGRLGKLLTYAKPGDYLFVEFGHNDQKLKGDDKNGYCFYADELRIFIREARAHGMIPVLVTPTHRRNFDSEGKIVETHADYPDGMRYVASREGVTLIDLHEMSGAFYESLGPEESEKAFVQGDRTHFNEFGAYELAALVLQGIKDANLPIATHIK